MAETLEPKVGAILGIGTPDASTLPTDSQIEDWLKEGSIYVMREAPVKALFEKWQENDSVFVNYQITAPSGYWRFVSARDKSSHEPVKLVSADYGRLVRSNLNSFLSGEKIMWVKGSTLYTTEATPTFTVSYIAKPTDSGDVPVDLHFLVIKYAVIMAKLEAQEMDEYARLLEEFRTEVRGV